MRNHHYWGANNCYQPTAEDLVRAENMIFKDEDEKHYKTQGSQLHLRLNVADPIKTDLVYERVQQ